VKITDDFTFQLQAFPSEKGSVANRLRPVKVSGLLKHVKPPAKNPPEPISAMNAQFKGLTKPQLDWQAFGTKIDGTIGPGFDRGHLIAEQFGGPNVAWNIVPMHAYYNERGPWRRVEWDLLKLMKPIGQLYVVIEIFYTGTDPRIPSKFKVSVTPSGYSYWFSQDVVHELSAREPIQIPDDIEVMFKWAEQRFTPEVAKKFMRKAEGTQGKMYPIAGPRPYAILDYLVANYNNWPRKLAYEGDEYDMTSGGKRQPGYGFHENQKLLIKFYNAYKNKGWLVSDGRQDIDHGQYYHGPHDTKLELNDKGGDDAPEVDHLVPESQGGSNCYCNARLVSKACNGGKGSRVKPQVYIDRMLGRSSSSSSSSFVTPTVAAVPETKTVSPFQPAPPVGFGTVPSASSAPMDTDETR
jgi:hypothetical protein